MRRLALLLASVLAFSGCDRRADQGPVVVSAIGGVPRLTDSSSGPIDLPSLLMTNATAQGLVRFDASGQIEPGIAERWTVIDNGMSYIFRLRDAEWSNGQPVTSGEVVAVLRRQIAPRSHNPLLPFLSAIDEIVEMTPEVIEIRLKHPRPDLLKLFAQPEMAVFRTRPPGGSGPFRIIATARNSATLGPAVDPDRSPDDDTAKPGPEANVRLIGERASLAITRFAARKSDLVSGGTFVDWPLLQFSGVAPANQKIDPTVGLFGLAIANRDGFLGDSNNRAAIARSIDRQAIVGAFTNLWGPTAQLLPEQLDSASPPASAPWLATLSPTDLSPAARVAAWRKAHDEPLVLRVALPAGPGATLVYGLVAAGLRNIGIEAVRVPIDDAADLRLVDAVAPYDSARWYLATACQPCGIDAQAALEAARDAPDTASRARHIADADAALAADISYIPIARPLRWSLVALRLTEWQGNSRAWHPLNHLRNDTK
ncbi:MAG: ABC transporter substrate-binding protein [Sphingomonas sp.]